MRSPVHTASAAAFLHSAATHRHLPKPLLHVDAPPHVPVLHHPLNGQEGPHRHHQCQRPRRPPHRLLAGGGGSQTTAWSTACCMGVSVFRVTWCGVVCCGVWCDVWCVVVCFVCVSCAVYCVFAVVYCGVFVWCAVSRCGVLSCAVV